MQTKVLSSELKIGMFVSELDRPWIDTPFLLQGFLIEDQEQLGQLQKYCEFALVDWNRSAQELRAAHPGHSPGGSDASQAIVADKPTSAPLKQKETLTIQKTPDAVFRPTESGRHVLTHTSPRETAKSANHAPESPEQESLMASLVSIVGNLFKKKSGPQQETFNFNQYRSGFDEPIENVMNVNPVRPSFIPDSVELTTYSEIKSVEEEFTLAGNAYKYTTEVLHAIIQDVLSGKHLAIEEVKVVIHDVVDSMVRNPDAMMWIARLRKQDEAAYGHSIQVAVYLVALGRHLGLPKDFLERLGTVGLLLDIGKLKLPRELLLMNRRLTSEEYETIKSHVRLGLDILSETPDLHPDIREGIAHHHERENGSGYPEGISKSSIGMFGRMAAIVDSFSALTNPRPYAEAMSAYEALQSMSNWGGEFYHAAMVEQFIQAIGVFPVGSMVELSSGEIAVVVNHSKVRRLKPRVLIISGPDKSPSPHPATLDLLYQPQETETPPLYILRGLQTGAYGLDAREYYLT